MFVKLLRSVGIGCLAASVLHVQADALTDWYSVHRNSHDANYIDISVGAEKVQIRKKTENGVVTYKYFRKITDADPWQEVAFPLGLISCNATLSWVVNGELTLQLSGGNVGAIVADMNLYCLFHIHTYFYGAKIQK